MANKLTGILLLATLTVLVPAQARGAISKSTLEKIDSLLAITQLGDSLDETMSAIEQLANSLNSVLCWGSNSPKYFLETLVDLYKANKANKVGETESMNVDCSGETESSARTLSEAIHGHFSETQPKNFVGYVKAELKEYAKTCAKFTLADVHWSISSLNGTVMDRVRTLGKYVKGERDYDYAHALYDYMLEQTRKEQDPDARYLGFVVDPIQQKAIKNGWKISELRDRYVTQTCRAYLKEAESALSRISWARNIVHLSNSLLPEELREIYDEIVVHGWSYKVCKQVLKRPLLFTAMIFNNIPDPR